MPVTPFHRKTAEAHLKAIARKHGIAIHWINGPDWLSKAVAYFTAWRIDIPRPNNARQYLVGLHEFGHLLGALDPNAKTTLPVSAGEWSVLSETAAWVWAGAAIHRDLNESIDADLYAKLVGDALATHLWELAILTTGQGETT